MILTLPPSLQIVILVVKVMKQEMMMRLTERNRKNLSESVFPRAGFSEKQTIYLMMMKMLVVISLIGLKIYQLYRKIS